jgi:trimeric autotransporter adhesin
MANLTLRSVKGSPLTNAELDGNFEYFTGSHSITGSLTVSGSIIPAEVNGTLGTAEHPWKELFIDGATIVFISGSSSGSVSFTSGSGFNFTGGNLNISGSPVITSNQTGSNATTGSNAFTGSQTISGSTTITGSLTVTGSIVSNGSTVITSNQTGSFIIDTGSFVTTGSNNFTGNQTITGSLIVTGSLTVSGSNTFVNIGPMTTGYINVAVSSSFAQGQRTTASGFISHAEGYSAKAFGESCHAEGQYTTAGATAWETNSTSNGITQLPSYIGNITSSFPPGTQAMLNTYVLTVSRSFFQANLTQIDWNVPSLVVSNVPLAKTDGVVYPNQRATLGYSCHAEGHGSVALGDQCHAEGNGTFAFGTYNHTEGSYTQAIGTACHAEGEGTIASGSNQHVQGQYNTIDTTSLMIVGNGSYDNMGNLTRRDAFKVRMSGSIVLPTTQSAAPSWTGTDGEMVFATVTGNHRFYVWMAGAWRSGSLA